MREKTVGHLARHLGHPRAVARSEDRRRTERIRAGVEGGNHQRVVVELAAEIELALALPVIPDRAYRQCDLPVAIELGYRGLAKAAPQRGLKGQFTVFVGFLSGQPVSGDGWQRSRHAPWKDA